MSDEQFPFMSVFIPLISLIMFVPLSCFCGKFAELLEFTIHFSDCSYHNNVINSYL